MEKPEAGVSPIKQDSSSSSEPVKEEVMDDSGLGTCSSVTTEDCTPNDTTPDKNDNGEKTDSKEKHEMKKMETGDCAIEADHSNTKSEVLLTNSDESEETSLVRKLTEDLKELSGSPPNHSLFKKRKCKMKSIRQSEVEAMSTDDEETGEGRNRENNSSPTIAKKQKTGAEKSESGSDEFVDASDVVQHSGNNDGNGGDLRNLLLDNLPAISSGSTSSLSSGSGTEDEEEAEQKPVKTKEEKEKEEREWLELDNKDLPLPRWRAVKELRRRQFGKWTDYWPIKACGCQAMVSRFELYKELKEHEGCVNALHFNQSGSLLASGSDDLQIVLWDWASNRNKPFLSFNSGHRSNVFQAKFLPDCGDATIVSTARDGQVRVSNISTTGTCQGTKKIAQHRGSAHKLALDIDSKSTFLSCGEDGIVFGLDLRLDRPCNKLATVKVGARKIPLYSIHSNPSRPYEFAVSGRDPKAHIFDRRMLSTDNDVTPSVKTFCPHHLMNVSDVKANITCLVYNWDGSELLCSYNDEDIYLFDTSHSEGADYVKRYKGHRNNATVKGVNFYGPHSEFVVSGSDCGNIFFWEKESSRIVQLMEGDRGGVVNVLEPHPNLPVIATSGLDPEVKVWMPSANPNEKVNQMGKVKEVMLSNRSEREEERQRMPDMIDGHMLWFLMRTLRNRSRQRRAAGRRESNNDTSSDDEEDNLSSSSSSNDGEDEYQEPRCIQS